MKGLVLFHRIKEEVSSGVSSEIEERKATADQKNNITELQELSLGYLRIV